MDRQTEAQEELHCCAEVAEALKALGHPVRLGIMRRALQGCLCVQELGDQMGCSQPNISQHLAVLRHAGLVVAVREGKRVCYRLSDRRIGKLLKLAAELFGGADQADQPRAQGPGMTR